MELTVRLATQADIPAIMEITRDAFTRYQRDLGLPGKVAALKETEETVLESCAARWCSSAWWMGVRSARCAMPFTATWPMSAALACARTVRKVGMGSALMRAVEAHCAPRGADGMALHTCAT